MRLYQIFQTLAIRAEQLYHSEDEDIFKLDDDTAIIVAASLSNLQDLAEQIGLHNFDEDNEVHNALLIRAVSRLNPDVELEEDDKKVIALLSEFVE